MRLEVVSILGGLLLVASTAAAAPSGSIDARQQRQAARIRAGIAQGQLTPPEARRLRAEQRSIAREERRLRRGGLTPVEFRHLQREMNRSSRHIARQAHDGQRRR